MQTFKKIVDVVLISLLSTGTLPYISVEPRLHPFRVAISLAPNVVIDMNCSMYQFSFKDPAIQLANSCAQKHVACSSATN